MAIYHLCVKTVSRSSGRSATAAAAYRAAERIIDERTGEIHDYTKKGGVVSTDLVLPAGASEWIDRADLWNAAEQSETRKNSTVAREFEVALPDELNASQRHRLALQFAQEIVARHRCAADVCIHEPSRKGDERNHHAHILCSTRRLESCGFTEKTRELDEVKQGEVVRWRERFSVLQNQHLRQAGHPERVDHRSLEAQGIDRVPTVHLGPSGTNYERRTGRPSQRRQELEQEVAERLGRARLRGQLERQAQALARSIIDTSGDLDAARQQRADLGQMVDAGRAGVRAKFEQYKHDKALREQQALQQQREAEQARQKADEQALKAAQQEAEKQRQIELDRQRKQTPTQPALGRKRDPDRSM